MKTLLPIWLLLAVAALAGDERAARMDALFHECDRADAPGASVLVIRDGKVLFKKAYGLADVEGHVRATTATNYRLASVTKQFTAMAIMILAERGKLRYDQPLSDFFPELPASAKGITLRQLLHHQSGLPDYEDGVPPNAPPVVTSPSQQLSDRDVLEFCRKQQRTLFAPGARYQYSNGGYVLLGLIVAKVSGMPYSEFLRKNIFEPLGMKRTVAHVEGTTTVPNRAYGYSKRGDAFVRTDQSPTSATLGDGGVYSSVEDLCRWDQALHGSRLIKRATFDEANTPGTLSDGKTTNYGFGWQLEQYHGWRAMQHGGSTLGFRTFIGRLLDKKFTVIVLMNRTDLSPNDLAAPIAELYLGARVFDHKDVWARW